MAALQKRCRLSLFFSAFRKKTIQKREKEALKTKKRHAESERRRIRNALDSYYAVFEEGNDVGDIGREAELDIISEAEPNQS